MITPDIIRGLAREGDFGFEMRIGRLLRSHNPSRIRHGESYTDPRTQVERKFDYQCWFEQDALRLKLAVECKNFFGGSPAVVCGHKRLTSESFHDVVFSGRGFLRHRRGEGISNGSVSEVIPISAPSALYPCADVGDTFLGKSVFRPKPPKEKSAEKLEKLPLGGYVLGNDDEAYECWNQAVGSAGAMALESLESKPWSFTVVLPMVVVPDGTLWRVAFSADGEPETPVQTGHVTLLCDHCFDLAEKKGTLFYRKIRVSHVHLVTEAGFSEFLQRRNSLWDTAFPALQLKEVGDRFSS